MSDSHGGEKGEATIRRLKIAVWALSIISLASTVALLVELVTFHRVVNGFAGLSLQEKIQKSSVIVLTKESLENGKTKDVLSEILKETPGTTFYYKVGDEFGAPRALREHEQIGDGQIVFFAGSPPLEREAASYYGERFISYGGISLEQLRQLIHSIGIEQSRGRPRHEGE